MTNDIQISEREREILRLVATGATNQQIAQQLNISANTVKVHLRNIFGKIGVVSRTEATLYAIRSGLVAVEPGLAPAAVAPEPPAALDRPARPDPEAAPPAPIGPARPDPEAAPPAPIGPAPEAARPRASWALPGAGLALLVLAGAIWLLMAGRGAAPSPAASPTAGQADQAAVAPRWSARAALPRPRAGAAVVAYDLDQQLYVIGGAVDGQPVATVDRYDPASDLWVTLADKPTPVGYAGAATLRGRIYVPGGEDGGGAPLDVLEVFDPRERRWEPGPRLPAPRSRYALAVWEGRLYLIGGWDGQRERGEVFIYDPEADGWSLGPELLTARRHAGAAVAAGRIYLVGGEGGGGALRDSERLDPAADQGRWEPIAPLPQAIARPGVTAPTGQILAFDPDRGESAQYDQQADAWRRLEVPADAVVSSDLAPLNTRVFLIAGPDAADPGAMSEYQAVFITFLPAR